MDHVEPAGPDERPRDQLLKDPNVMPASGEDAVVVEWEMSRVPGNTDDNDPIPPKSDEGDGVTVESDNKQTLVPSDGSPPTVVVDDEVYDIYGKFLDACRWFDINGDKFLRTDHLRLILQSSVR